MNDLSAQRTAAKNALPEKTLTAEASLLEGFEVLLAYNLDYPYRYCQDYWWLEVLASSPLEARALARDWVMKSDDRRFECTDLVRAKTEHYNQAVSSKYGTLLINWDIAVEKNLLPGTALRNPTTGQRVGFLAQEEREREVFSTLEERFQRGFRLLLSRPVSSSRTVCLAPEVEDLSPLRRP